MSPVPRNVIFAMGGKMLRTTADARPRRRADRSGQRAQRLDVRRPAHQSVWNCAERH
jgi:hypothetical protein